MRSAVDRLERKLTRAFERYGVASPQYRRALRRWHRAHTKALRP